MLRLLKNRICDLFFYTLRVDLGDRIHQHYCWSVQECMEWMACYPVEDRCWITSDWWIVIAQRGHAV